jgi:tetratricopeptide (TPR) repeat protein
LIAQPGYQPSLRERAEAAVALRDSTEEVTGNLDRPSDPLPSFSSSSHELEPPTVPGNVFYPRSVPGYTPRPEHAFAPPEGFEQESGPTYESEGAGVPKASLVLQHLARVGLFEPAGAVRPAWEQAPKRKTRGSWVLILATVLVAVAGTGGYYYARHVKAERLQRATALNDEVAVMLNTGALEKIRATDEKLTESFELDSLSKKAARLWLQNRVLNLLLAPGDPSGIDSASHRAKQVELQDHEFAFGKVASFLSEGDLAGAAALLPKWDKKAGKDAYYQLTGGAVLERAGDLRAIERYEAARALDKKLLVADLLLARLVLLEMGPEKAKPVIDSFEKKGGEEKAVRALRALAWAVDRDRPEKLPEDAQVNRSVENELVVPLRPVVYVVDALRSIESEEYELASTAIEAGVARSLSPAMATRLGFLAIQADNEKLARNAALRALKFSAVYPGARVLAARVALLGGRLDEAQKAIEQLDPDSPEVAVVRGVVGYETLDTSSLSSAVESFGDDKERFELSALAAGTEVLLGTAYPDVEKLEKMAQPQVPWGQLVAVDAALALGELELAEKLVKPWPTDVVRPVFSLRLARLYRYQGKKEKALQESERALITPSATAVVERVLSLLESEDAKTARSVVARYPVLLGTAKDWLNILIDVSDGQEKRAKAAAAALDPPPEATPLLIRLLAARALVLAGDKRGKAIYVGLRRSAKKHPEVEALGKLL